MKKLLVTLAAVLVSVSAFAQGTINFNNRGLQPVGGGATYNQMVLGDTTGATAGLFLVTGTGASLTYTPLTPTQGFRAAPNGAYVLGNTLVTVPGVAAGTTGTRVVMRAWVGASYDATTTRGQSGEVILGPLGGIPPTGPPVTPPNLDGLQNFTIVPEPSTIALGLLGAASLLFRRRK